MATHSNVLAWRIPGIGEPGGLPSMGSHRVRHDSSDLAAAAAVRQEKEIKIQKFRLKSNSEGGGEKNKSEGVEVSFSPPSGHFQNKNVLRIWLQICMLQGLCLRI